MYLELYDKKRNPIYNLLVSQFKFKTADSIHFN